MEEKQFAFLTDRGRIIPNLAVLTNEPGDFLNDAYVIIEDDGYDAPIIDVQNWEKQRFRYVHHEYTATRQLYDGGEFHHTTTCQLYDVDAIEKHNCSYHPGIEQVNLNSINREGRDVIITGALGKVYVFIHRLKTGEVEVYLRQPGSLVANRLWRAKVTLQELAKDNPLWQLREEYGRIPQSYWTASRDVKYSIIRAALRNPQDQAAIKGAISLCQTEPVTGQICQRLAIQDKATMCLSGFNLDNPRACDKLPVISQEDFEKWIPRRLETNENDELQLTHDFYLQNYKLPNEGYAESMYKARVINTICALIRPDILVDYADILPPLPSYLNLDLIKRVIESYKSINREMIKVISNEEPADSMDFTDPYGIRIRMVGANDETVARFKIKFRSTNADLSLPVASNFEFFIKLRDSNPVGRWMLYAIENSSFVSEQQLEVKKNSHQGFVIIETRDDMIMPSHALLVSEILKIMFDYGFLRGIKTDKPLITVEAGPIFDDVEIINML